MEIKRRIISADEEIKVVKIKVKVGTMVYDGQILLIYEAIGNKNEEIKQKKLKSTEVGVIKNILIKEGDVLKAGAAIIELDKKCNHPTVIKDLCAECGADLQKENVREGSHVPQASVSMIHMVPELKVNEEVAQSLGRADIDRLLNEKKLVLLVDLDQTLIHTTNDNIPNNIKDVYHFQLYGPRSPWYHTRLRPGTHKFLQGISDKYELHICTFGSRRYAHMIARFLDPDGKYFSHRILSRDECFDHNLKTANLRALFPCGEQMVCIIDDREDVWDYASNLIHVKPYHFFQHTGDIHAPPGLTKCENDDDKQGFDFSQLNNPPINNEMVVDNNVEKSSEKVATDIENEIQEKTVVDNTVETFVTDKENEIQEINKMEISEREEDVIEKQVETIPEQDNFITVEETDDYLLYLEEILKIIQAEFFKRVENPKDIPNLKQVIPETRANVLKSVNMVFSGIISNRIILEDSAAYKIARSLGAKVTQNIESDTTHLVALQAGTAKVHAAYKRKNLKLVTPEWLWTCAERWEKVDEKLFPLEKAKLSTESRHPPAHCRSPDHPDPMPFTYQSLNKFDSRGDGDFLYTINPLMSLSSEDIETMEGEVEDIFNESDEEADEAFNQNKIENIFNESDEEADESFNQNKIENIFNESDAEADEAFNQNKIENIFNESDEESDKSFSQNEVEDIFKDTDEESNGSFERNEVEDIFKESDEETDESFKENEVEHFFKENDEEVDEPCKRNETENTFKEPDEEVVEPLKQNDNDAVNDRETVNNIVVPKKRKLDDTNTVMKKIQKVMVNEM